jgi:hypothetical protein
MRQENFTPTGVLDFKLQTCMFQFSKYWFKKNVLVNDTHENHLYQLRRKVHFSIEKQLSFSHEYEEKIIK